MKIPMKIATAGMAAFFGAAIVVSPALAMGRNKNNPSQSQPDSSVNTGRDSNGLPSDANRTGTNRNSSPSTVPNSPSTSDSGGAGLSGSGNQQNSGTTGDMTGTQDSGAPAAQPGNTGSSSGY